MLRFLDYFVARALRLGGAREYGGAPSSECDGSPHGGFELGAPQAWLTQR